MLGLTGGELFIVVFVTLAVVSARFWPELGARLAERLSGAGPRQKAGNDEEL